MCKPIRISMVILFWGGVTLLQAHTNDWPQFGGNSQCQSQAENGPDILDPNLGWQVSQNPLDPNLMLKPEAASGPVVYQGTVYVHVKGPDDSNSLVAAYDAVTGETVWTTKIDPTVDGSWATPCIDARNQAVLVATGNRLFSLHLADGGLMWPPTVLQGQVIGGSPCIADDLLYNRVFVVDGYYTNNNDYMGRLYCINLDDDPNNPYAPGELVWENGAVLGETFTNTPCYKEGRVYVAATDANYVDDSLTSHIYGFDANASEPTLLMDVTDDRMTGRFNGGLTISDSNDLYAATFNFNTFEGGQWASLCKVHLNIGQEEPNVAWVVPAQRTNSVPVVIGDMIYLSTGDTWWPSSPRVQAFKDNGDSATLVWETQESMMMGGWTNQPVYAGGKLYVGGGEQGWSPSDPGGYYSHLYILDVAAANADPNIVQPDDPNFILSTVTGYGNQPAVTDDSVYSLGPDGLAWFYQPIDVSEE